MEGVVQVSHNVSALYGGVVQVSHNVRALYGGLFKSHIMLGPSMGGLFKSHIMLGPSMGEKGVSKKIYQIIISGKREDPRLIFMLNIMATHP